MPLNILGETAKDDPDMLGFRYEAGHHSKGIFLGKQNESRGNPSPTKQATLSSRNPAAWEGHAF